MFDPVVTMKDKQMGRTWQEVRNVKPEGHKTGNDEQIWVDNNKPSAVSDTFVQYVSLF